MALITCQECGGQVSERANACPHCGNPIARDTVVAQQLNENQGGSTPRWIIPVLIVALVALAATIGFILYNKSQSEPAPTVQAIESTVTSAVDDNTMPDPVKKGPKVYAPSMLTRYCIMTVNYGYVNVRKRPSTNSGVVKRLYDGDSFYGHLSRGSNWIEYTENGVVRGYVRQDVVRKPGQSRYFYNDNDYYNGATSPANEYYAQ